MKEETKNEFLFSHFPFHPLEMGIAKGGKWNRRRGRKSQTLNTQTVVRLSHIAIMFSPNNMSFFANFSSIFSIFILRLYFIVWSVHFVQAGLTSLEVSFRSSYMRNSRDGQQINITPWCRQIFVIAYRLRIKMEMLRYDTMRYDTIRFIIIFFCFPQFILSLSSVCCPACVCELCEWVFAKTQEEKVWNPIVRKNRNSSHKSDFDEGKQFKFASPVPNWPA